MYRGPKFLVTPLLMGPVCLLSQGLFERQVRLKTYMDWESCESLSEFKKVTATSLIKLQMMDSAKLVNRCTMLIM